MTSQKIGYKSRKRSLSSQSPGNKLAAMLDDRLEMKDALNDLKRKLSDSEIRIMKTMISDPVGFEGCFSINWRRLERMFGG